MRCSSLVSGKTHLTSVFLGKFSKVLPVRVCFFLFPTKSGSTSTSKHGQWPEDWWFVQALFRLFWPWWQFTHYLCVTKLLQPVLTTISTKAVSSGFCLPLYSLNVVTRNVDMTKTNKNKKTNHTRRFPDCLFVMQYGSKSRHFTSHFSSSILPGMFLD